MPKVKFDTGQVVNFDSMPSAADIEEVANKLGINKNIQTAGNPSTNPDLQGGPNAPAVKAANQNVKDAQYAASPLGVQNEAEKMTFMPMANAAGMGIPDAIAKGLTGKSAIPENIPSTSQMGSDALGAMMPGGLPDLAFQGAAKLVAPIGKYMADSKVVKQGLEGLQNTFTKPYGLPKESLVRSITETGQDAIKGLKQQQTTLNKTMSQATDKAAVDIQHKLPEYFKNNSTTYGKALDNISDGLVKSGNEITRGEMSGILDKVLQESQDDLLASGKPMDELNYLSNKYSLKPQSIESPILGENGKPIESTLQSGANDKLDFKEVVNDVKQVRNSLSSKAKMGQNYTPEDVVAAKFMKNWGDYLETKVPALKQLNQEYAPVISTMKIAGKYFKPYSQGVDKLQGVSFLKNMAQDKLQASEKKLLDVLQNGTQNFPGIGDSTSGLTNIKNSQDLMKKNIDDTVQEYAKNKKMAQDLLDKEKELTNKRNQVVGALTATGLLTGVGGYAAKKVFGK